MKGSTVVLDHLFGREVAARLVDGRLDDLLVAGPDPDLPVPGAIYRAAVDRPMKGQGGVTVRLPAGHGFLRQAKGLRPGQTLLVQVAGGGAGGKAPPVTSRLLLRSRYAIATPDAPGVNVSRAIRDDDRRDALLAIAHGTGEPPAGTGLILRSACETAADDDIAADIAATLDLAARVIADRDEPGTAPVLLAPGPGPHLAAWCDWPAPDTLADAPGDLAVHGVIDMIAALRRPEVDLGAGAWMAMEPTAALVAVDVNTGADTSLAAGLKANLAMARALGVHLRLRGLGGQVTLDPAPMPKKDRRVFEQVLRAALKGDAVATVLAGWTPLGCFELQRRRERLPLADCLRGLTL